MEWPRLKPENQNSTNMQGHVRWKKEKEEDHGGDGRRTQQKVWSHQQPKVEEKRRTEKLIRKQLGNHSPKGCVKIELVQRAAIIRI